MRLEIQQSIIKKALKDNKIPFTRDAAEFHWSGTTKVKSKNTGRIYDISVNLFIKTASRLAEQVSACLLKPEGVRMEDLLITGMIDPKLVGSIDMKGMPKDKIETDLGKLIRQINKASQ